MGRSQKAKGSRFERRVCELLSLWVSAGSSKDLFWRSSQSGGRATSRRKTKETGLEHQSGDIAAIHPDGHPFIETFFVECKDVKSVNHDALLYKTGGPLEAYWRKLVEQSTMVEKVPMLVYKELYRPIMVGFPAWFSSGRAFFRIPILTNGFPPENRQTAFPNAIFPRLGLFVFELEKVLSGHHANTFIRVGQYDADYYYRRFTSYRSTPGCLPVEVLQVVGNPRIRRAHCRRRLNR